MLKNKFNLIITSSVFIVVSLTCLLFPNLEFQSAKMNRSFGVFFNIFCIYLTLIIFLFYKKIKYQFLKNSVLAINSILLLFIVLNFALYLLKLDPKVQYYDVKTIYIKKGNMFEKINEQYYINWKTNERKILSNRIYDFGPFRNYLESKVDTSKIGAEWIRVK